MAMNPLIKSLVNRYSTQPPPESPMKLAVRREVQHNAKQVAEDRTRWFHRYTLPPASVLARLSQYDRHALIAHFRAKELQKIAEAMHVQDFYNAGLARKRLERVSEMEKAFVDLDSERFRAA